MYYQYILLLHFTAFLLRLLLRFYCVFTAFLLRLLLRLSTNVPCRINVSIHFYCGGLRIAVR